MIAAEIMTKTVKTVGPDATIDEAIDVMLSAHVSGLPVVDDDGKLIGVISEGDFLNRAELGTAKRKPRWIEFLLGPGEEAEAYVLSHGRKVHDVMTRDVATVEEATPLTEIVQIMEKRHVKRVPVVSGGFLVGIISRADLLRALAQRRDPCAAPDCSDDGILKALMAELKGHNFASPQCLDVTVDQGVVTISGEIFDDRQREALKVACENIPGVKSVHDKLVWVEPFSGMVIDQNRV